MKKNHYLVLFFLFSTQFFSAQNYSSAEIVKKYEIKSSLDKADDFFISSFEKADWDKYRYEDERRTLRFENGVVIELLSATELLKLNILSLKIFEDFVQFLKFFFYPFLCS